MSRAACLMLPGPSSGLGKSLRSATLCRIFGPAGYRVAPFKAQNVSLADVVAAALDVTAIGRLVGAPR